MKKNSPSILIFFAFLFIGVILVVFLSIRNTKKTFNLPESGINQTENTSTSNQGTREESVETLTGNSSANGMYLIHADNLIEQYSNQKRILFFYANWCPTCRPVDEEIESNLGNIPEGVVIIRVNYNDSDTDKEEKELAAKYGITYQHTFVELDSDGNAVQTWNGGSLSDILNRI